MSPKAGSLGQQKSNRSGRSPALFAEGEFGQRGHPSTVPSGSPRSPLTGPGRAAEDPPADSRKGQAGLEPGQGPHTEVMDAEARNQYLRELREEYGLARKALKSQLLDEAVKRIGLAPERCRLRLDRRRGSSMRRLLLE